MTALWRKISEYNQIHLIIVAFLFRFILSMSIGVTKWKEMETCKFVSNSCKEQKSLSRFRNTTMTCIPFIYFFYLDILASRVVVNENEIRFFCVWLSRLNTKILNVKEHVLRMFWECQSTKSSQKASIILFFFVFLPYFWDFPFDLLCRKLILEIFKEFWNSCRVVPL